MNPRKLPRASEHLEEPITHTNLSTESDTYIDAPGRERELSDRSSKRRKDTDSPDDEGELSGNLSKRMKGSNEPVLVTKQDQYIYNLRVERRLTWKETSTKFSGRFKKLSIPALQMRLTRSRGAISLANNAVTVCDKSSVNVEKLISAVVQKIRSGLKEKVDGVSQVTFQDWPQRGVVGVEYEGLLEAHAKSLNKDQKALNGYHRERMWYVKFIENCSYLIRKFDGGKVSTQHINAPPGLLLTFSLNWKPSHDERRRGHKIAEMVNWVVNGLAAKWERKALLIYAALAS